MRRLLFILLFAVTLSASGQYNGSFWIVPSMSNKVGKELQPSYLIWCPGDLQFYKTLTTIPYHYTLQEAYDYEMVVPVCGSDTTGGGGIAAVSATYPLIVSNGTSSPNVYITTSGVNVGQIIKYNGSSWIISDQDGGSLWRYLDAVLQPLYDTNRVIMPVGALIYPGNGDANDDGGFDGADILKIGRYIHGLDNPTDRQRINSDLTGDQKVTNGDRITASRRTAALDGVTDEDWRLGNFNSLYQYYPKKVVLAGTYKYNYLNAADDPFDVETGGNVRIPKNFGMYLGGATNSTDGDTVVKIYRSDIGVLATDAKTIEVANLIAGKKAKQIYFDPATGRLSQGDTAAYYPMTAADTNLWVRQDTNIYNKGRAVGIGTTSPLPGYKATIGGKLAVDNISGTNTISIGASSTDAIKSIEFWNERGISGEIRQDDDGNKFSITTDDQFYLYSDAFYTKPRLKVGDNGTSGTALSIDGGIDEDREIRFINDGSVTGKIVANTTGEKIQNYADISEFKKLDNTTIGSFSGSGLRLDILNTATAPTNFLTSDGGVVKKYNVSAAENMWSRVTGATNNIYNLNSGNVGIGTSSPLAKMSVYGTGRFGTSINAQSKTLDVAGDINFDPVTAPVISGLTLALAGAGAGNVDNGVHYYSVSYYDAAGNEAVQETTTKSVTVSDKTTNGKVSVTGIPTSADPRVVGRKLYRSAAGIDGSSCQYLATIADNVTTTYTDNTADASLGAATNYRRVNYTSGRMYNAGTVIMKVPNAYETALGVNCLLNNTTGNSIVGVGGYSLYMNTTGNNNVAIGYKCLYNNTTAQNNVGVGYAALFGQNTGPDNTAIGTSSLRQDGATTAYGYNTAVGSSSLNGLTTNNNYNVGIGYRGGALAQGTYNVFIGSQAGYKSGGAASTGTRNTIIGADAGQALGTTGYCTFLGAFAGKYETGTGKLIIDSYDRTNEANQRLYAPIYGEMSSTAANQRLFLGGGGRVGIGSGTAGIPSTFSVTGSARFSDTTIMLGKIKATGLTYAATATRTIGIDTTTGMLVKIPNVGTVTSIATTSPITGGPITGSGTIGIQQANISQGGYLSSTDWNSFNNRVGWTVSTSSDYIPKISSNSTYPIIVNSIMYESGGKMGIGTTTPAYNLEVAGTFGFIPTDTAGAKYILTWNPSSKEVKRSTVQYTENLWSRVPGATDNIYNLNSGLIGLRTFPDSALTLSGSSHFMDNMRIDGKLGIGTTNPDSTLHVTGGIHTTGGIKVDSRLTAGGSVLLSGIPSGAGTHSLAWDQTTKQVTYTNSSESLWGRVSGSTNNIYNLNSGVVGVGTTSLTTGKFNVNGGTGIGIYAESNAENTIAIEGKGEGINAKGVYGYSTGVNGCGIFGYGTNDNSIGVFGQGVQNGGRFTTLTGTALYAYGQGEGAIAGVFSGGNVGIGTSTPNELLHVEDGAVKIATTTSDYVKIDVDKGTRYYGTATVWDDLAFPATQLRQLGANSKPDFDNDELGYLFPYDSLEVVGIISQMPHRWKEGSTIYPHIHIAQTEDKSAVWRMAYRVYNICSSIPAWTKVSSTGTKCSCDDCLEHDIVTFPAIDMTNKTVSCIVDIKIWRKTNSGTSSELLFKMFDLHYEIDSDGSKAEYTKD